MYSTGAGPNSTSGSTAAVRASEAKTAFPPKLSMRSATRRRMSSPSETVTSTITPIPPHTASLRRRGGVPCRGKRRPSRLAARARAGGGTTGLAPGPIAGSREPAGSGRPHLGVLLASPGLRRPSVSSRAALRAREWATSGFVITFTHSDKRAPRIWLGLARNDHAAAHVPSQRDGTLLTFGRRAQPSCPSVGSKPPHDAHIRAPSKPAPVITFAYNPSPRAASPGIQAVAPSFRRHAAPPHRAGPDEGTPCITARTGCAWPLSMSRWISPALR